jgi:hypothetical protein
MKSNGKEAGDGIKKTIVPSILGVVAGVVSYFFSSDNGLMVLVLLLMITIQTPIYRRIGVNPKPMDWLSISFMTFGFWFLTLTLMLN